MTQVSIQQTPKKFQNPLATKINPKTLQQIKKLHSPHQLHQSINLMIQVIKIS